ncbi:uncharacterized protein LOC126686426 [Mercurialis annua]|uniref:uncharacterized protein LOC126686426 n=1 Tax=Mercurialis annua TaxID=3986 RepID=UPI00215F5305|nr:uncharacterized protein LOC126686426 [Mercurialis annua]
MKMISRKSKRTRYSDSDFEDHDDLENGNLMMEEETSNEDDDDQEVEEEDDMEELNEEDGSEGEDDLENDNGKDNEMEDLEKDYKNLRNQELDILKNLTRHKEEDLLKGQAVKNQKALWDKILEFRFLLQKAFSASNRLPQNPVRSSFCDSDEGVGSAYADLITSSNKTLESLLGLQEALLEKNPSISQSSDVSSGKKHAQDSKKSDAESEKEWLQISEMHMRIASFRDKSIDKWQRKTRVTTGAAAIKSKLQAFNQDISAQVASYMRDPSRMTKQMQLSRSAVSVFGTVLEKPEITNGEESIPDGDPELLDDSEFYQQLLKEFFETIDPSSSEMAFYAMKKLRTKKRKIVDRRASKSRKIRYNVHDKIVSFMAPRPMNLPPTAPKLFENLFGLKTQQPASAV